VLDIGGAAVRAGITADEIDRIVRFFVLVNTYAIIDQCLKVHEATIERGAYPSPLNYHLFPKSVVL
jgi:methionyl aminopeptidase